MKILFKEGVGYKKESNDWIADNKVKTLGWRYASREEWKKNDRDVKKTLKVEEPTDESKHSKTKERRAKNHSKIKEKQTHS